jgi:hypothetical protein
MELLGDVHCFVEFYNLFFFVPLSNSVIGFENIYGGRRCNFYLCVFFVTIHTLHPDFVLSIINNLISKVHDKKLVAQFRMDAVELRSVGTSPPFQKGLIFMHTTGYDALSETAKGARGYQPLISTTDREIRWESHGSGIEGNGK